MSGNGGGRGGGDNGTSGMGGGDMEAMREKIRLLEAQLAREKMKSTQQMPGPQPIPAHTGLMYGNTAAGYSTQVQQYAPTARVQVSHTHTHKHTHTNTHTHTHKHTHTHTHTHTLSLSHNNMHVYTYMHTAGTDVPNCHCIILPDCTCHTHLPVQ